MRQRSGSHCAVESEAFARSRSTAEFDRPGQHSLFFFLWIGQIATKQTLANRVHGFLRRPGILIANVFVRLAMHNEAVGFLVAACLGMEQVWPSSELTEDSAFT